MGGPCRVSIDLRQHQAEQNAAEPARDTPNFADEDDLRGIVDESLHAPLAQLFSTRDQIQQLLRSEGLRDAVNHRRAVEWMLDDLAELERLLRELWESA